ncbi:MAG: hypothetical protein ACK5XN_15865 [Bacteroidota bacterium]|jgi:hypothetical protein
MAKLTNTVEKKVSPNISRPGIHAKSQTSSLKTSKNYKKAYRAQGRV